MSVESHLWDILPPAPMIEILETGSQMTFGERAALAGVLGQLRPELAIEIGTAEGGSLRLVAQHSGHVHSFDLVVPEQSVQDLRNVTLHTGDSHALLPRLLDELAREGKNVDFVLVDGDHTSDGVERDVRDLLASEAIKRTVILLHDTLNDDVRAGLKRVDYRAGAKVAHVDLDVVPGHLSEGGPSHNELWGGLGLILVSEGERAAMTGSPFYDFFDLIAPVRDQLVARERGQAAGDLGTAAAPGNGEGLRAELAQTRAWLESIQSSASWRLTAPLRAAKQAVLRRR
jgi:hypothetical protein